MSDLPEYKLERTFDAPRELVWRAWTDPELLQQWYGPGVETIIHKFDLQVGGEWLNEMKWGGNSNYQRVVFQEVNEPEKMVWHHYSATDAEWNTAPNPMMPDWPALLLTTVTFTELGDRTAVCLTQVPMDASEAEITCFAEMMKGMDKGWGSGFDIIEQILAEL
ncbi:MAG: SRPBCC domain-containing protein [Pseudomonadota bacterium]